MLKNYLKTAWRNLQKHRTFSLINILGLAIGLSFSMITGAFIWSEYQVNRELKNNDRICMIQSKWKDPNMGLDFTTLAPLSKALKENFPDLVSNYYHHDGITSIVSKGDKKFSEGLQVGDASLLNMFGFPLLYGNAKTALTKPNSLALTAKMARKYFGRTDVIGETLTINSFSGDKQDFEITAVMKDPPMNTVTNWGNGINKGANDFFLPTESLQFFGRYGGFEAWQNAYIISYVELKEGVTKEMLKQPVQQLMKLNTNPDVYKNLEVYFTPVKDYYLQSNNGIAYRMIYALGFAALFILLMAIINFINISIGNSTSRLREIGVRKVMGSSKQQLIFQFLVEAIVMVGFSVFIALLFYSLARPIFSTMLGKEIPSLSSFPPYFIAFPVLFILLIGLLAGLYPAFVLSRQKSISSLKGKMETVKEKVTLRYSLIAVQFTTSIIVFITAVFIEEQVSFFFDADLGYNKERIITTKVPRDWSPKGVQHMETLRNEFARLPGVSSASFSFEIPDGASANINTVLYKASQDSSKGINATSLFTDEKFAQTYGMKMLAGTFFNEKGGLPVPGNVVINTTAAAALGFKSPGEAIGQKIKFQGNPQICQITGVLQDFHFSSLQEQIRPIYFIHTNEANIYRYLSFKLKAGNMTAALSALQKKWTQLIPDAPFDYSFMDDTLARLYTTEKQMRKASQTATIISLAIVLLGVLGIVTQSITKRTKEVGVRKVLGASILQVILLFVKEFSGLVIIANLVAWPLAYLAVNKWLDGYAYKINVSIVPFIAVGTAIALLVALLIVAKTFRAAIVNPVDSLRTE